MTQVIFQQLGKIALKIYHSHWENPNTHALFLMNFKTEIKVSNKEFRKLIA